MKTLIAAAALALTATVAHADIDYQKVFKAQGKTAAEIINGFDMALGRAGQQVSGNRLTADSTSLCLINKLLGVNLTAYGQIVIEAKNNQYRVTIQNTKLEYEVVFIGKLLNIFSELGEKQANGFEVVNGVRTYYLDFSDQNHLIN